LAEHPIEVVVALGNHALQYFEPLATVGALHGCFFEARGYKVFCSYHPAAALRAEQVNKIFLDDMLKLGSELKESYSASSR